MVLTKEQFESLINYLDSVSSACTDVIVRNGKIRQLSDDRTVIFDIDTGLNELDANLQLVKSYVNIFKVFIPEDENETISLKSDLEKKTLLLKDDESTIKFMMGDEKYLNASFIEDEKFSGIVKETLQTFSISPRTIKKINTLAKDFATEVLNLVVDDKDITLSITSASKTKKANITKLSNDNNLLETGTYVASINLFSYKFENPVMEICDINNTRTNRGIILKEGNVRIMAMIFRKE